MRSVNTVWIQRKCILYVFCTELINFAPYWRICCNVSHTVHNRNGNAYHWLAPVWRSVTRMHSIICIVHEHYIKHLSNLCFHFIEEHYIAIIIIIVVSLSPIWTWSYCPHRETEACSSARSPAESHPHPKCSAFPEISA